MLTSLGVNVISVSSIKNEVVGEVGNKLPALLIIALVMLALSPLETHSQEVVDATATIYVDGTVEFRLLISPPPEPGEFSINLVGTPYYVEAEQGGVEVPVSVNGTTCTITSYGTDPIVLTYYTTDLTSKQGDMWELRLSNPWTLKLVLSDYILPVGLPENVSFTLVNDTPAVVLPPGNYTIKYFIVPEIPTTTTPATTQTGMTGTPTTTTTAASPPTERQPWFAGVLPLASVAVLAAVAVILAYLFLRHRRGGGEGSQPTRRVEEPEVMLAGLDERDRMIVDYIREHGKATASELLEKLGIPKTPLYRKLNKLVKAGILKYEVRGGVRYYVLAGEQGSGK